MDVCNGFAITQVRPPLSGDSISTAVMRRDIKDYFSLILSGRKLASMYEDFDGLVFVKAMLALV